MANENPPIDLNGDPELTALAVALREGRPAPDAEFIERLDAAVADHFPPEWSDRGAGQRTGGFGRVRSWLGGRRDYLLPLNAGLAGLAVIAVAVVIGVNGSQDSSPTDVTTAMTAGDTANEISQSTTKSTAGGSSASPQLNWNDSSRRNPYVANSPTSKPQLKRYLRAGIALDKLSSTDQSASAFRDPGKFAYGATNRKVAHEADLTLGTTPDGVQEVSNEVVDVVDDHHGIVLDSSVKDGPAGEAGASFSLMIPTEQLESTVSDLSGIADLRARAQETEDITAPTLTVEDSLRDSRARVDSLVKELSEVTTDEDRARVETELAEERRQAARLTTRLNKLERKANLTPVGVSVETGGDTSGDGDSSWGIGDAIDDAGHMLAVSAGVALIALAITIPVGLMVLIALALNRAWVRRSRRRALEES